LAKWFIDLTGFIDKVQDVLIAYLIYCRVHDVSWNADAVVAHVKRSKGHVYLTILGNNRYLFI
jgi:hypothetical protein